MTNIVKFPRRTSKPRYSHTGCVAEPLDVKGHVNHAKLNFTCVHCHTQHHMQFDNMIFRTLDLFCGKCGNGWKISNPMFITNKRDMGNT